MLKLLFLLNKYGLERMLSEIFFLFFIMQEVLQNRNLVGFKKVLNKNKYQDL